MAGTVRTLIFASLALSLAACGKSEPEPVSEADKYDPNDGFSLSKLIGATKSPPDEFAVMTSKPLELPQSFTALPVPNPGQRSPLAPDPVAEARSVLLGDSPVQPATARVSVAESALLSATGTPAPADIRTVLEAEQVEADAGQRRYLLEDYFPSLRAGNQKDAIKPEEERVRLSTLTPAPAPATGIATIPAIPTGASAAPITAPTVPQAIPAVPTVPDLPTVDPVSGTELIYIPE